MMLASDIAAFYQKPLGVTVRCILQARIEVALTVLHQQRILGLGFTMPYLKAELQALNFMLARCGASEWPKNAPCRTAQVDELNLPLPDHSMDAALIVHGLEFSENAEDMLHEVWRVLAPQGKLVLVVPNRRGLWAQSEASPFGRGQPFSQRQISKLMRESDFEITQLSSAFVSPPLLGARLLSKIEITSRFGLGGGVLVVEGIKKVHGLATHRRLKRSLPRLSPMLAGLRPINKA